jgi:hypothetical protein
MSGELRLSQFRWTTTANDDFVIGSPDEVSLHNPKFLVFQTNTTPGYASNPHFRCEYNFGTGAWEFKMNQGAGASDLTLTGMAYLANASPQTFSGVNIFNTGDFTINSLTHLYGATTVVGTTSGNVLTVNSTTTFNNDVTVTGTLNVSGPINHTTTTNLDVVDNTITLNKGGLSNSGGSSGIEVEEAGGVAGYNKIEASRLSWVIKAPGANGTILFTPATSYNTELVSTALLSHKQVALPNANGTLALTSDLHAAVTLGTPNGLGLTGQQLTIGLASSGVTGALSGSDWNTFNSKAADNTVVHLAGIETITGSKTFSSNVEISGSNALILTDHTNSTRYQLYVDSGILHLALA